ncbi:MAG: ethanolamine ammonia-lyase subunit EutC [Lapillicoccus sp.]
MTSLGNVSGAEGPIAGTDAWEPIRRFTTARVGMPRAGNALATRAVLELASAHAAARDAVHVPLDVPRLSDELRRLRLGEPTVVASAASTRGEYLRRPDLGRRPAQMLATSPDEHDVAVVVIDGLSPRAVQAHAYPLLAALLPRLPGLRVAAPVIATQGRVALGDHIGAALRADVAVVLIGERPGLSAADSLGAYLTYGPTPGRAESERNCVSNIRPPGGLSYDVASTTLAALVHGARALGVSGITLKQDQPPPAVTLRAGRRPRMSGDRGP